MWQPNRAQWRVIWFAAIVLILAWPPSDGPSLAIKAAHWLVDPRGTLPRMPDELPMGLGDDGFAVAAHDEQLAEYYRVMESSSSIRARVTIRDFEDPYNPTTERQLLVGFAILSALLVWKLGDQKKGA